MKMKMVRIPKTSATANARRLPMLMMSGFFVIAAQTINSMKAR